jgi:hypothetical protein
MRLVISCFGITLIVGKCSTIVFSIRNFAEVGKHYFVEVPDGDPDREGARDTAMSWKHQTTVT